MTYRGPQSRRIGQQVNDVFLYAGQTATLVRSVSAVTGNTFAGFGDTVYSAERTVTAIFGRNEQPEIGEAQGAGGMIGRSEFTVTTREPLRRDDVLLWRGETYRVDSEAVPSRIDNAYVAIVKRSST